MRIAVCFSGQTRTSTEAFPNLRRFFGTAFENIDFFIHTWDISYQKKTFRREESPRLKVPQERFDQLVNFYNPKKIEIEHYEENSSLYYHPPMYYSWYKSVMLCRNHEIENNFRYDAVVKLRTDIIFPSFRFFMSNLEYYLTDTDKFYIQGMTHNRADDVYWMSNSDNMVNATMFVKKMAGNHDIEFIDFLREINMTPKELAPTMESYTILRDECLHLDVLKDFKGCFECDHHHYGACDTPWGIGFD